MCIPPLCECGCGEPVKAYNRSRPYLGHVKGEYPKRKNGHNRRKNEKTILGEYEIIFMPSHPNAYSNGYVLKHIVIATKALGKPLPPNAQVHHINGNPLDNALNNLVICPDQHYHKLLHTRTNALNTCGNPNYEKCNYCKKYDNPNSLTFSGVQKYHQNCKTEYERDRKEKIKLTRNLENQQ